MNNDVRFSIRSLGLLLALAVCCVSLPSAAPAQDREGPVVFLDEPVAPYCVGEMGGLATGGISYDLLSEVFGRMGLAFELKLVPWARVLKTVEHGQADGVPLLMKNEEREAFLVFTDPVAEHQEIFYYLPERLGVFHWTAFSDLKPYTVGLISGYTYDEDFLKAIDEVGFKTVHSQDMEANLRLLLAGRVDMILEDDSMIGPVLAEHPDWSAKIAKTDKPVSTYYWYMAISRLSPLAGHVDEINKILSDMRSDGSLEDILNGR